MLSGGHYTGVVYCYILSITCINYTICDAEWWSGGHYTGVAIILVWFTVIY